MIPCIELERPQILPEWDLVIDLETLSKPPYDPLWEVSLRRLTYKTVLLLDMASDQKHTQTNDPLYIPVVLTRKSEFDAPHCPVRYYHRYMSENPELRKGRRRLLMPINNAGNGAISSWICVTKGESHASMWRASPKQSKHTKSAVSLV